MELAKYAFFWGCQIPARLPFMEKSTRLVLESLAVDYTDLAGFTCCPEKSLVRNFNKEQWLLTAARNLSLAEQAGLDLVTACNGCYSTLKSAHMQLRTDHELKKRVNYFLQQIGLQYQGVVKVKHLVELLHDEVGPGKLRSHVQKPFSGMRIATHPGCHMLRPSSAIRFDDPLKPTKLDALVEALGAHSVDYQLKMTCCGGALSHAGEEEDSLALTRKKLLELQKMQVDALVLLCPACFIQYDQKQYLAQRRGERLNIPVFTYPELLGLALGLSKEELGLESHRVAIGDFLARWEQNLDHFGEVKQYLDLPAARRCFECGACVADCPVAETTDSFKPRELIGRLLEGKIEELLQSKEPWYCVECHTCYELCPQKFGMEKVFGVLKRLAWERGLVPASIKGGVGTFLKTGRLGEPDERNRKKLGLTPFPSGGAEDWQKLLEICKEQE
jgi:CoB--CoM heterodisulfide reductase subunit B